MMKKIEIEIRSCYDCPRIGKSGIRGYRCLELDREIDYDTAWDIIPPWCPLSDAEEELEAGH